MGCSTPRALRAGRAWLCAIALSFCLAVVILEQPGEAGDECVGADLSIWYISQEPRYPRYYLDSVDPSLSS